MRKLTAVVLALAVSAGSAYAAFQYYYLPGSVIHTAAGDVDVSMKSEKEATERVYDKLIDCVIEVSAGNNTADIPMDGILSSFDSDKAQALLSHKREQFLDLSGLFSVDGGALSLALRQFNSAGGPKNAEVQWNGSSERYIVVPEEYGKELLPDAVGKVMSAIQDCDFSPDLMELDCYAAPEFFSDDIFLNTYCRLMNAYSGCDIILRFPGGEKTVTFSDYRSLLDVDGDMSSVIVRDDTFNMFFRGLCDEFTTLGKQRQFHTSAGTDVELSSRGTYGWVVDESLFRERLINALDYNSVVMREIKPVVVDVPFSKTASGTLGNDIGDSYVEVSLEKQKFWMYLNGEMVKESSIVSGGPRHRTNRGVYKLAGKARNQTLRGWNDDGTRYASFVNYWMPFDGGIGLHDATWRSSFGGNIYQYNGSHGCVNLPKVIAKFLYENITYEMPIIVW